MVAACIQAGTNHQPRGAFNSRDGPVEGWCFDRSGTGRDGWDCSATSKRVSEVEYKLGSERRTAASQLPRTCDAQEPLVVAGCSRLPVIDCVRERCKSADGARHIAPA